MKHLSDNGRREFLRTTAKAGMAIGLSMTILPACAGPGAATASTSGIFTGEEIPFEQTPLPYAYNKLEPAIDAMTMEIHYSKHAATYAKMLAEAVKAENVSSAEKLTSVLSKISKYTPKMRNNAGGHYNHEFFWKSMQAPADSNAPSGALSQSIIKDFGSFDAFKTQFADAGKNRFGSGWAWLVKSGDGKLVIGSTPNQDNPLMDVSELKGTPLLGLDVWEHAYYLKYQNKRPDYITAWWSVVNWQVVGGRG